MVFGGGIEFPSNLCHTKCVLPTWKLVVLIWGSTNFLSAKGQIADVLDFAGQMVPVAMIHLCHDDRTAAIEKI